MSRKMPVPENHRYHPEKFESVEPLSFLLTSIGIVRQEVPGVCRDCMDRAQDHVIRMASKHGPDNAILHDLVRLFLAGMQLGEHDRVRRRVMGLESARAGGFFEELQSRIEDQMKMTLDPRLPDPDDDDEESN